ncbi:type II toxin-antitoxin system RelE/ParE family toxin [Solitalea lacus]|uniref:type II toxin-antitoxin system RelE/ParE family toxin n=1 Tax=Solitalea lacus TaxID=2911172 RepID=UPI001EDC34ED|nr:type II toxin-antitoxin system RelE/ParE family toxin [Solitalea lacus]UKJ09162.1 type II toxin-antitoxin system RelE/ParE family toxin [Solitalea lacus]
MKKCFEIEVSEDAEEFLEGMEEKAKLKFAKVFLKVKEGLSKEEDFKKLKDSDGIFEFRVRDNKVFYRILAFMAKYEGDDFTTIICTHGFLKTTDNTPKSEIQKAKKIKKTYLED